jgi:hypothetical protein
MSFVSRILSLLIATPVQEKLEQYISYDVTAESDDMTQLTFTFPSDVNAGATIIPLVCFAVGKNAASVGT